MRKRKEKRYNLKKVVNMQETIRCKILAIVGWVFNININMPDYEFKARLIKKEKNNGKSTSNN